MDTAVTTDLSNASPPIAAAAASQFPKESEFFNAIEIPVSSGEQAQFVIGDNLAGYYEGYTHAFRRGVGYQMHERTLFHGHASFVNGVLLDRTQDANRDVILPFGHRAEYAGATESMQLHAKRYALSLRVDSREPAVLTCLPLWDLRRSDYDVKRANDVVLLLPKSGGKTEYPEVIALSASAPFRVENSPFDSVTYRSKLGQDNSVLTLGLSSAARTSQFTIHIAFGFSQHEAEQKARALAKRDTWREETAAVYRQLTQSQLWTSDMEYNRALVWAKASASSFVVEEFGHGIWAGLPWFRDNWGRDTFIAMPGTLLVSGRFGDAKAVLENFARQQNLGSQLDLNFGRIPNRVAAGKPTIYNTVDGTPWLIREALEYLRYSGDESFAKTMLPLIRNYVKGVQAHWVDSNGLLTHDDADTWMDARIANQEAWSPRGNRAVEIQALWFTALETGAILAQKAGLPDEAKAYQSMAKRVQEHFPKLFWNGRQMADRVRPDDSGDFALRPNQLMLVTIPTTPFISESMQAQVVKNAVGGLLYPYGIASLDPRHPNFHPRHENPVFHHKDAAYHNGTIWGWNAGFTITALNKFGYQDLAWQLSQNLAQQILYLGTRGSMSELLDAVPDDTGQIHPSGTFSQAWSVAEFVRNGYQDFLGFRPDLLEGVVSFVPALPADWCFVSAQLPFGNEKLTVRIDHVGDKWVWQFYPTTDSKRLIQLDLLTRDRSRQRVQFAQTGQLQRLSWDGEQALLDGVPLVATVVMASQSEILGDLKMATPRKYDVSQFPVLRGKDVLQKIVLEGKTK